jgi:hypothetical protein
MKMSKVLAAALGFLLGSAAIASAGVVMSETATASGPGGKGIQRRMIYIQGDKQKVDSGSVQSITDLDKRVFYLIDKQNRNYVEVPLAALEKTLPGGGEEGAATIELERTGRTRVVGANRCDEYRGGEGNNHVRLIVSACVSNSAPGAREVARFDRKMVERLAGIQKPADAGKDSAGVVLQKKSVLKVKVPSLEKKGFRTASVVTRTTVDNIEVKRLAEQTFLPPEGYTRLKTRPPRPRQLPQPDNVQSVMRNRSELDA